MYHVSTQGVDEHMRNVHYSSYYYYCSTLCFSYGYPDATYLSRVQEELAAKGVTYEDLTEKQKKFIYNPESSWKSFLQMDFSDQFNKK